MVIKKVRESKFCDSAQQDESHIPSVCMLNANTHNEVQICTRLIWSDSWSCLLVSKGLTHRSLICWCTIVNINVTKPYWTLLLIRLHVIMSTLLKCISLQHISTVLSFIHLPVCHPPIPPPSLHLTSWSLKPLPIGLPNPSFFPHILARSHSFSPPLPLSFFLSTPLNLY